MSAWIVSTTHIDALVCGAIRFNVPFAGVPITEENATIVGAALLTECIRSVMYRYKDSRPVYPSEVAYTADGAIDWERTPPGLPGPVPTPDPATYQFTGETTLQPINLYKQCACYSYQSREHPEWEASASYRLIEDLEDAITEHLGMNSEQISYTENYDRAPWGIRDAPKQLQPDLVIVFDR